jgi:uncharacterized protein YcfJ
MARDPSLETKNTHRFNVQEINMKTLNRINSIAFASTLVLAAAPVWAGGPYPPPPPGPVHYTDTARVLSSTPVYEQVNQPTRECWREQTGYTTVQSDRSYGGAILGAIVGGVVGHQIGGGSGKDAATAAGAVVGAMAGDNLDNRDRPVQTRPVEEERCRVVDHWTRRVTGYNVIYRYRGNEYSTFMNYDPGATVRLDVSVNVIDR